jgi:hypothetical protein
MLYKCLALILLFYSLIAIHLRACDCAREETDAKDIQANYRSADLVFEGLVTDTAVGIYRYPSSSLKHPITFEYVIHTVVPSRVYKGKKAQKYMIRGGYPISGDCSINLKKGHKYLIYAVEEWDTALLTTSLCSRTRMIEDAGADLRFLQGLPPTKDDVRTEKEKLAQWEKIRPAERIIRGRIHSGSRTFNDMYVAAWALINGSRMLLLDYVGDYKDGNYCISLPPGTYFLGAYEPSAKGVRAVGFYPNASKLEDALPINLPNKDLNGIDWTVFAPSLTTLKGKLMVTGSSSIPRGKYVIRFWNGWDDRIWDERYTIAPGPDGKFELRGLYPGKFEAYPFFYPDNTLDLNTRWHLDVTEIQLPNNREFEIRMTKVILVRTKSQLPRKKSQSPQKKNPQPIL